MGTKIKQTSTNDRSTISLGGLLGGSWRLLLAILENGRLPSFFGGSLLGPSWKALGAVLALSWGHLGLFWPSKWNQDGYKIDSKIDRKNDTSWERFWEGFWRILGRKMDPSWHENDVQDGSYLEKADKPETLIKPIEF